jgi:hypothetical protein
MILQISASQVARIISVSHQCLAKDHTYIDKGGGNIKSDLISFSNLKGPRE